MDSFIPEKGLEIHAFVYTDFPRVAEDLKKYGSIINMGMDRSPSGKEQTRYGWFINFAEIARDLPKGKISKADAENLLNRLFGKERYSIEWLE